MKQALIDDVHAVEEPTDMSTKAEMSMRDAETVLDIVETRAANREFGRKDVIVVLQGWALDDQYGPIADERYLLVTTIEEYSKDSYKVEGAYYLNEPEFRDPEKPIHERVERVDEQDDGAPDDGIKWVPKSAIDAVFEVQ
jgi:hypothetical protein